MSIEEKKYISNIELPSGEKLYIETANTVTEVTANPDTLADVISNATPNTTIYLEEGNYDLLTLTNEKHNGLELNHIYNNSNGGYIAIDNTISLPVAVKFPENLTIIGNKDVKMSGLCITSGCKNHEITHITDNNEKLHVASNLTIKNITFTEPLSLRNCVIDGLNIVNNTFWGEDNTGSYIILSPDSFTDIYGRDTDIDKENNDKHTTATTVWHSDIAKPQIKNIKIEENTIKHAQKQGTTNKTTAILVQCVNGAEITNNIIDYADFNGIQLTGVNNHFSTGKILISGNEIKKSGSRGIRVNAVNNGKLTVCDNDLKYGNQNEVSNKEQIKISNCKNTSIAWQYSTTSGQNQYWDENGSYKLSPTGTTPQQKITIENCISQEELYKLWDSIIWLNNTGIKDEKSFIEYIFDKLPVFTEKDVE